MEDRRKDRKSRELPLQRCCECSRIEDQLWALAYETVWPQAQRRRQNQPEVTVPTGEPAGLLAKGA